jgi:hypothetical protein
LIADCTLAEFIASGPGSVVVVQTPEPDALAKAVTAAGGTVSAGTVSAGTGGRLEVRGLEQPHIADIAMAAGIRLDHLAATGLEDAFRELTAGAVQYRTDEKGA